MNTKETGRPAVKRSPAPKRPVSGNVKKRTGGNVATKTPKKRTVKKPTPDVVYTQPGPFNRNRFLLQLATVVAVVLALLFGMSIFFKVKTVTVTGMSKYTAWDIREASGIQEGENLLTISEPKLSSNIRSRLPYVDTVRIGIKLPDTVKIEIKELDVVYAIEASDGSWWLMRADGGIVEKTNSADALQHTQVLGVKIADPEVGKPAVAANVQQNEEGETVPVAVLPSEQLNVAISILQYLEDYGVIGEAASVNVSDMGNVEVWYGERFQILLGDTTQLSYKLGLAKNAIDQHMQAYDSGILDASLTVQPDPNKEYQVIYTPFGE